MGYTASYLDNRIYGAQDLNRTVSQLVTEGVADPFTDGLPYNVTKLNDIIYSVSSDGVVPDSVSTLKCTVNNSAKTVTIAPGTAFFANGSTITVDVDGATLPYTAGTINYVYVKSDMSLGTIAPACTTTAPTGDYVMLAEVSAAGTVTDRRKYAQGKVPGYQSNANATMHISKIFVIPKEADAYDSYVLDYPVYIGVNNYSGFVCLPKDPSKSMGMCDFVKNQYHSFCFSDYINRGAGYYSSSVYLQGDSIYNRVSITATHTGEELILHFRGSSRSDPRPDNLNLTLDLTIF